MSENNFPVELCLCNLSILSSFAFFVFLVQVFSVYSTATYCESVFCLNS